LPRRSSHAPELGHLPAPARGLEEYAAVHGIIPVTAATGLAYEARRPVLKGLYVVV